MSISFFRTLLLYLAIITALRVMGKRQIGELEPTELVITIMVSELAAIPMQDLGVPLISGLVPIATLIALEILMSFFCLKSRRVRRLLNGQPAVIIKSGQLDIRKLREMRLTTDEVLEALRQQNIASVGDVKYGLIEPSGQLSCVLKPKKQPLTAEMLTLSPRDSGLPFLVISDGKLVPQGLTALHLTEEQLLRRLHKANHPRVEDIFMMTLDDCGNQFIQPFEK